MKPNCNPLFMLLILLLGVLQPSGGLLFGQHDWTWTFGDSVIMRFPGGGSPIVFPLEHSRNTRETGACYSDSFGNLQAFANSDSVWNGNSQIMVNGEVYSLEYYTQGVLFLPDPVDDTKLHLWSLITSCLTGYACPTHYLIDLDAQNGRGEVVSFGILGYPGTDQGMTERLNAVKHADGKSWWVFLHDDDNADYYRYLMTANGIASPQSQTIGSIHGPHARHAYGQLKFSQDGTRMLVVSAYGIVDVFDVDRCTGLLSNWIPLGDTVTGNHEVYYGCSFSPDGTKIYASTTEPLGTCTLYQWDLSAVNILASKTAIYSDTDLTYWGQHQLGPDGKIYITQEHSVDSLSYANHALSVISDPNQPGLACNFQYLGLDLQGRRTSANLPNLPNYNLGPLLAQTAEAGPPQAIICLGDSIQIGYPDTTGGTVTFAWQSHPDIADTTQPQQWVTPPQSTWYYLTVVDSAFGIPCGVTHDSIHVIIADSSYFPVADAGPDQTVCLGGNAILSAGSVSSQWTYHWNTGIDSTSIVATQTGTYTLIVNNPVGVGACLSDTDHVELRNFSVRHAPLDAAGFDKILCYGDSVEIGVFTPGFNYQWVQGPTLPDTLPAWVHDFGEYILAIYLPQGSGGCLVGYDSVYVSPCEVGQIVFHGIPFADTVICIGDSVRISVEPPVNCAASWSPVQGLSDPDSAVTIASPVVTTVYTVEIRDTTSSTGAVLARDNVTIVVEYPFDHNLPTNQSFCPGEILQIGVEPMVGYAYRWSPITDLQNPYLSSTTVAPLTPIVYTLAVTSDTMISANCKTQYFPIALTTDGCIQQNVVTPNGDGINDYLNLGSFNGPITLSIYDRWGDLVFSSNAYTNNWPQASAHLPETVYWYVVNVATEGGKPYVGEVMILR